MSGERDHAGHNTASETAKETKDAMDRQQGKMSWNVVWKTTEEYSGQKEMEWTYPWSDQPSERNKANIIDGSINLFYVTDCMSLRKLFSIRRQYKVLFGFCVDSGTCSNENWLCFRCIYPMLYLRCN